jgi:hypothetical protein
MVAAIVAGLTTKTSLVAATTYYCNAYCYGQQVLFSGTNGIDGYVFGTQMNDLPPYHHIAEYLAVAYGPGEPTNITTWVQAGEDQGHWPVLTPYAEWEPCGLSGTGYGFVPLGSVPSPPNIAFYIRWDGGTGPSIACPDDGYNQVTMYRFMVQRGNLSNPITYAYMRNSSGFPIASLEDESDGPMDDLGHAWFGEDNNHNPQPGYELHLYTFASRSWTFWTRPDTQVQMWDGMYFHDDNSFDAAYGD